MSPLVRGSSVEVPARLGKGQSPERSEMSPCWSPSRRSTREWPTTADRGRPACSPSRRVARAHPDPKQHDADQVDDQEHIDWGDGEIQWHALPRLPTHAGNGNYNVTRQP